MSSLSSLLLPLVLRPRLSVIRPSCTSQIAQNRELFLSAAAATQQLRNYSYQQQQQKTQNSRSSIRLSKGWSNCSSSKSFTLAHGPLHDSFNIQDEADFKDKVTSVADKPIVVEFHATWCGPCKMLMPRLESKIGTTQNQVDLAKVDIDDHPDIAMEYGVGAVPSVLAFINGQIVDKFVGLKDEDEIDVFINKLLPTTTTK